MCERRKHCGYSLIELLIVMAVVVIFMAITAPVYNRMRQIAKELSCKNNLRQNYYLLNMFANANDGFTPQTDYPLHTERFYKISSVNTHSCLYYLWQAGFVPNAETFYCPSAKLKAKNNWQNDTPAAAGAQSSYQFRLFFSCNGERRNNNLLCTRNRASRKICGRFRLADYSCFAILVDAFGDGSLEQFNHSRTNNWNVLFNDSSVQTRSDCNNKFSSLDLNWHQAGDWCTALADGRRDIYHNVSAVWYFFDKGFWPDGYYFTNR